MRVRRGCDRRATRPRRRLLRPARPRVARDQRVPTTHGQRLCARAFALSRGGAPRGAPTRTLTPALTPTPHAPTTSPGPTPAPGLGYHLALPCPRPSPSYHLALPLPLPLTCPSPGQVSTEADLGCDALCDGFGPSKLDVVGAPEVRRPPYRSITAPSSPLHHPSAALPQPFHSPSAALPQPFHSPSAALLQPFHSPSAALPQPFHSPSAARVFHSRTATLPSQW